MIFGKRGSESQYEMHHSYMANDSVVIGEDRCTAGVLSGSFETVEDTECCPLIS